ncbi:zf-HC2 domain-containing protein [Phytoactinopolyspora limicola]|uniref:zf-HC2 domain-containing protein n=1 Tax=Phytoactinopolyspora limicola TaxID=2715536 RepID=UPI00140B375F|nr:zf-HC2 domain-containing protein [Phytoactinopolyspora limicola]
MTWHVARPTILAYVDGDAAEADAWSIEAHVTDCERCRTELAAAAADDPALAADLAASRTALLAGLPPQGRIRRGSPARGLRILLASGPAARGPWLLATLMVLALAIGLDLASSGAGLLGSTAPVLVLLAPLLPVLGVAASYGSGLDDAHEIIATTAAGGLRLLLIRTTAVLAVTVPATIAAGLVTGLAWSATWLVPGLALTTLTLLGGTVVGVTRAAALVGGGWALVVAVDVISETTIALLTGPATPAWLAVFGLSAAALVLRRAAFNHLPTSIRPHSEA